jgi:hypothetical protein
MLRSGVCRTDPSVSYRGVGNELHTDVHPESLCCICRLVCENVDIGMMRMG